MSTIINTVFSFLVCFCSALGLLAQSAVKKNQDPVVTYRSFNSIAISAFPKGLTVRRTILGETKTYHPISSTDKEKEIFLSGNSQVDTVPVSFGELQYKYQFYNANKALVYTFITDNLKFPKELIPRISFPGRPLWDSIYYKAWDLTWQGITSSSKIPVKYIYNDYPDNRFTYVWDACFCTLFQRYSAVHQGHPGIASLDLFYAIGKDYANGYIPRRINIETGEVPQIIKEPNIAGINPPLFSWTEILNYNLTNDTNRLKSVLPILIKHYWFWESFMQKGAGHYIWDGDGSGWDNINWNQGSEEVYSWVDAIGQQAFAALNLMKIALITGDKNSYQAFEKEYKKKKEQINIYWNKDENWYCGLTKDNRFTRKTLQGIWPVMAEIADSEKVSKIIRTLTDTGKFNTSFPLPVLSKDEKGYNPKGEYWLGSVWINMSILTIKSLKKYKYNQLSNDFAVRTVDGVARVYSDWQKKPGTLWECYAPEYPAPASHKLNHPDTLGTVRSNFRGYTDGVINLFIEEIMGINIFADKNLITWEPAIIEDMGIANLKFGKVTTSLKLRVVKNEIQLEVNSDSSYALQCKVLNKDVIFKVKKGYQKFLYGKIAK